MKNALSMVLLFFLWSLLISSALLWNLQSIEKDLTTTPNLAQGDPGQIQKEQSSIATTTDSKISLGVTHTVVWLLGMLFFHLLTKNKNRQRELTDQIAAVLEQKRNAAAAAEAKQNELGNQLKQQSERFARQNTKNELMNQTRAITNRLLIDAFEPMSFTDHLDAALFLIMAIPWLEAPTRGAIFLWNEEAKELVLAAHYKFPEHLQKICSNVPLGHCLCGQAAQTQQMVFSDHTDKNHVTKFSEKKEHGYYCLPIIMGQKLVGVINILVAKGRTHSSEEKASLQVITNTLADIISRCQQDEELAAAKINAEQATQAKSEFLANMSHDIRTPMNAILGMGEILQESQLDDEQKKYVQTINHASEVLLALINDILDLSKIEADRMELETIAFNPSEIVQNSIDILNNRAAEKGIDIATKVANPFPKLVIGDPQRLKQIFINLLSNGIKFTQMGKITITLTQTPEKSLLFAFTDTGIGIPEERQKTIFQPFTQANTSTTRHFGGTGLGLSISRKLVEKMAGRLWVVSQPGEGSTFYVDIPFQEAAVVKTASIESSTQPEAAENITKTGISILLADDNEENGLVIAAYLKKTAHRLTFVNDGIQAVEQFKNNKFGLILMDINMPRMGGYEATKEIRAWEQLQNLPQTPILALTANAMKDDIEKTRLAGCNLHLSKPIRQKNFFAAIAKFIPSPSSY